VRELTQEEFEKRWAEDFAEWGRIRDELDKAGVYPSAYDVTLEQRKRMLAEGRTCVSFSEDGKFLELTPGEAAALRRKEEAP